MALHGLPSTIDAAVTLSAALWHSVRNVCDDTYANAGGKKNIVVFRCSVPWGVEGNNKKKKFLT